MYYQLLSLNFPQNIAMGQIVLYGWFLMLMFTPQMMLPMLSNCWLCRSENDEVNRCFANTTSKWPLFRNLDKFDSFSCLFVSEYHKRIWNSGVVLLTLFKLLLLISKFELEINQRDKLGYYSLQGHREGSWVLTVHGRKKFSKITTKFLYNVFKIPFLRHFFKILIKIFQKVMKPFQDFKNYFLKISTIFFANFSEIYRKNCRKSSQFFQLFSRFFEIFQKLFKNLF